MRTILSALVVVAFISVGTVSADDKAALGVVMSDNTPGGVLVTKVLDGSPAAKIGLQSGDRILSINGQKTNNYKDVGHIIKALRPGAMVELVVFRGAWKTKLTTKLAAADAVYTPAPTFVSTPVPTHPVPNVIPDWVKAMEDDPSGAGVEAAYGGGGY